MCRAAVSPGAGSIRFHSANMLVLQVVSGRIWLSLEHEGLSSEALSLISRAPDAVQGTTLVDGSGARPGYSLRTLCRALEYAANAAPTYGLQVRPIHPVAISCWIVRHHFWFPMDTMCSQ